jgi:hypothetical protein
MPKLVQEVLADLLIKRVNNVVPKHQHQRERPDDETQANPLRFPHKVRQLAHRPQMTKGPEAIVNPYYPSNFLLSVCDLRIKAYQAICWFQNVRDGLPSRGASCCSKNSRPRSGKKYREMQTRTY